jgi:hypothetical protein
MKLAYLGEMKSHDIAEKKLLVLVVAVTVSEAHI